jgi:hypothetical protein
MGPGCPGFHREQRSSPGPFDLLAILPSSVMSVTVPTKLGPAYSVPFDCNDANHLVISALRSCPVVAGHAGDVSVIEGQAPGTAKLIPVPLINV